MSATGRLPTHEIRRGLLERFRPEVRSDSHEAFFADSVSEMLSDPVVELRRGETVIARAGPGPGDLSEAFFTGTGYRGGRSWGAQDKLAFTRHDYRVQARALRAQPGIADVVYGHFACSETDERYWLQYWFFMLYNDAQLIGRFGLHEGDWEMAQFRLAGSAPDWDHPAIDEAVYAQHNYAERLDWARVQKTGQEVPLVYSALGSHASYFGAGIFKTDALWDVADGEGPSVRPRLVYLDEDPPGWLTWPGMWGGTEPTIPDIESSSPTGPAMHEEFRDPGTFAKRARPAIPVKPLQAADSVRIRRALQNYPTVDFDFEQFDDPALFPGSMVIEIHPPAGAGAPAAFTFGVDQLIEGSLTLRYALDPGLEYEVAASWRAVNGATTPLAHATIPRLPMSLPPVWMRWFLYALRWLLQRITGRTR